MALFVLLMLASSRADDARRDVWRAAAQGLPVLVALVVAMRTLASSRSDVRVERAVALHRELMTAELGDARRRLANHLRLRAEKPTCSHDLIGTPRHDATLLTRFFGRVEVAWDRDTVDQGMLCRLIGRHADGGISPSSSAMYASDSRCTASRRR